MSSGQSVLAVLIAVSYAKCAEQAGKKVIWILAEDKVKKQSVDRKRNLTNKLAE